MMRTVLVTPLLFDYFSGRFAPFPPLGALSLRAQLEREGLDTHLVDPNRIVGAESVLGETNWRGLVAERILELDPTVVGFSTVCESYHEVLEICRAIKTARPHTVIVLGGPHATLTAVETLSSFPWIDFICLGEAELSFSRLLRSVDGGKAQRAVPGIALALPSEGVVVTEAQPLIGDLDDLPFVDYAPYEDVIKEHGVPIETGRGCPFRCSFCASCGLWRGTVRLKSPKRVVREVRAARDRFGVRTFLFVHDLFTAHRRFVRSLCDLIAEEDLGIRWACSARVDSLRPADIRTMRSAGCFQINFGLESASERTQGLVGKRIEPAAAKALAQACSDHGVIARFSMIVGFPGEGRPDLERNLELVHEVSSIPLTDFRINYLAPQPGTRLFEEYGEQLEFHEELIPWSVSALYRNEHEQLVRNNPKVFPHFHVYPDNEFFRTFDPRALAKYFSNVMLLNKWFPATLRLIDVLHGGSVEAFTTWNCWLEERSGGADRLAFATDLSRPVLLVENLRAFVDWLCAREGRSAFLGDVFAFEAKNAGFRLDTGGSEDDRPDADGSRQGSSLRGLVEGIVARCRGGELTREDIEALYTTRGGMPDDCCGPAQARR